MTPFYDDRLADAIAGRPLQAYTRR